MGGGTPPSPSLPLPHALCFWGREQTIIAPASTTRHREPGRLRPGRLRITRYAFPGSSEPGSVSPSNARRKETPIRGAGAAGARRRRTLNGITDAGSHVILPPSRSPRPDGRSLTAPCPSPPPPAAPPADSPGFPPNRAQRADRVGVSRAEEVPDAIRCGAPKNP
jgi:hypothetical protein